jgi:Lysophospholipase L1 and related esterases
VSRHPATRLHRFTRPFLLLVTAFLGVALAVWLDRQGYIAFAHDLAPASFQDGDVVCFVGDSITEDGRFISYLHAFYLTRFPDRRIRFVNTGTAGDSVGDVRHRLEWDVLPHAPNVVSIMLGTNDVRRHHYDPANTDPERFAARALALDHFRWNLDVLATQLAAQPTRPELLLVTPPPYDETAAIPAPSFVGVNAALDRVRSLVARVARKHRARLIDLHAPLTELNTRLQSTSPSASLVGPDRIHPDSAGHLLIACHYLLAQRAPSLVSEIVIDPRGPTELAHSTHARISGLTASPGRLAFDSLESALPFPVDPAAADAVAWFPLYDTLNRQMLTVSFADDAIYRLLIDGESIADIPARELREGINLARFPHMPQNRQSHALLATLEERRQLEIQLRRLAHVRTLLHRAGLDPDDDAAVEPFLTARRTDPDRRNASYFDNLFADYETLRGTLDRIESKFAELTARLHQLNRPAPHRFELVRLDPAALATR